MLCSFSIQLLGLTCNCRENHEALARFSGFVRGPAIVAFNTSPNSRRVLEKQMYLTVGTMLHTVRKYRQFMKGFFFSRSLPLPMSFLRLFKCYLFMFCIFSYLFNPTCTGTCVIGKKNVFQSLGFGELPPPTSMFQIVNVFFKYFMNE